MMDGVLNDGLPWNGTSADDDPQKSPAHGKLTTEAAAAVAAATTSNIDTNASTSSFCFMTLLFASFASFTPKRMRSRRFLQQESDDSESSSTLASHRSCLKKQNILTTKRPRQVGRVQFADEPVSSEEEIELVQDSWISTMELSESRRADVQSVEYDIHIQSYLRTTDEAFIEVVSSGGRTTCKSNLRQAMIHGAGKGYRALECTSRDAQQRSKSKQLAVVSILAKSRLLKSQGVASRDKQLCKHAEQLSRRSRQWALFLGETDASVAAAEYATVPPSLLLARRPNDAVVRQGSRRQPMQFVQ